MRKKIKKLIHYEFNGPAPADVSPYEPELIGYYGPNGLIANALEWGVPAFYSYDQDNRLVKTIRDKYDGTREIWEYCYDPDGALLRIHMEVRELGPHYLPKYQNVLLYDPEFFARDEDDKYEPTGYYLDEWYSWEGNGRICRREERVHHPDGTENKVCMYEEYDECHNLLARWYGSEQKDEAVCRETYFYDGKGTLIRAEYIEKDEDDDLPLTYKNTSLYDEHENVKEEFREGLLARTYEYQYDDEGRWIRKTCRDAMGFLIYEDVRIIEYDETTALYDH